MKYLSSKNRGISSSIPLESFRVVIIMIITITVISLRACVERMPPCGGWLASSFVFGRPNLKLESDRFFEFSVCPENGGTVLYVGRSRSKVS